MRLREIAKGASSRERKRVAGDIWLKWKDTANEDLADACITNFCETQCAEESDSKRFLPRYKAARENVGDRQQRRAKAEAEKIKVLEAWEEYYYALQTEEEPLPPKEYTKPEYVQARCLTLMTIMITMANENLLEESNICEAYGLAQEQIYGLTYSVSRRLVGPNPETKDKELKEHMAKVREQGNVPSHIWHGNQSSIVGHMHYGTSVWGPQGEHLPTEPSMEKNKRMM